MRVIGEGTVKICSLDGSMITLSCVRHVPESRCNLISLGALYSKGFNFRFVSHRLVDSMMPVFNLRQRKLAMCTDSRIQIVACNFHHHHHQNVRHQKRRCHVVRSLALVHGVKNLALVL